MIWYKMSVEEALSELKVVKSKGLSAFEAKKRIMHHGKNLLSEKKKESFFKKLIKQLSDFMVITLLVAAVVSFGISYLRGQAEYIDSLIILFIVVLNTAIGVMQESRAEKAIDSLKKLSSPHTKVLRDGKIKKISSQDVVPGDILVLKAGDLICADARIVESTGFFVEESAITGESFSISKSEEVVTKNNAVPAEQKNMIFTGSVVTRGHARAVVTGTGMNTEVGKIASLINKENSFKTPLSKRLESTGKVIGILIIIISVIVFVLGVLQHADITEMFMISISLAVAAIPEGLPAVVTIVLAGGVKKMASCNAIVRNLPAVETLGHTGVICCDKTGTLTMNKMVLKTIMADGKAVGINSAAGEEILKLGTLCNNSFIVKKKTEVSARGEPTENAILLAAVKAGISKNKLDIDFKRVYEIPFNSTRKIMTTLHETETGGYISVTKGAPDIILKKCNRYKTENGIFSLDQHAISKIEKYCEGMSNEALRVIGVAYKEPTSFIADDLELEKDLIFCGVVGIEDPVRPEAIFAVKSCRQAGIKPVMITGDHASTAKAIDGTLGMSDGEPQVMTGEQLNKISEEQLEKVISSYCVFARVSPEHKVKIVKAFQKNGAVVAMTGDGVNDAPALKAADIGCAMGKSGTDAAKSAADMVIADDNFATIVEAVKQGRGMFDNIKKTIHFLLSTNIGEVMVVLIAFLIGVPTPLLAVHLLWINMVTDAFPALALGVDPIEPEVMKRPVRDSKKGLFSKQMSYNIIVEGCFIAAVGFLAYTIGRVFFDLDVSNPVIGRTMSFATLGLSQIIHAFNVQSSRSLFETGIFKNMKLVYSLLFCIILQIISVGVPCLNEFFRTQPLNFLQWMIVIISALMPVVVSEAEKHLAKNRKQICK